MRRDVYAQRWFGKELSTSVGQNALLAGFATCKSRVAAVETTQYIAVPWIEHWWAKSFVLNVKVQICSIFLLLKLMQ